MTALRCAVQCGVLRRRRITFAHTSELGVTRSETLYRRRVAAADEADACYDLCANAGCKGILAAGGATLIQRTCEKLLERVRMQPRTLFVRMASTGVMRVSDGVLSAPSIMMKMAVDVLAARMNARAVDARERMRVAMRAEAHRVKSRACEWRREKAWGRRATWNSLCCFEQLWTRELWCRSASIDLRLGSEAAQRENAAASAAANTQLFERSELRRESEGA